MPKRDPRWDPKAGDVLDDPETGTRYFLDNAKEGGLALFEARFYTNVTRANWRKWARNLRPVCLRMVPLPPDAIRHCKTPPQESSN